MRYNKSYGHEHETLDGGGYPAGMFKEIFLRMRMWKKPASPVGAVMTYYTMGDMLGGTGCDEAVDVDCSKDVAMQSGPGGPLLFWSEMRRRRAIFGGIMGLWWAICAADAIFFGC